MGNICGTQNVESKPAVTPYASAHGPMEIQGGVKLGAETNASFVRQMAEAEAAAEIHNETHHTEVGPKVSEVVAQELKELEQEQQMEEVVESKIEARSDVPAADIAKEPGNEPTQEPKNEEICKQLAEPACKPAAEQPKTTPAKSELAASSKTAASMESTTSTGPAEYVVVGGGDKGGIMVRKGKRTSSKELPRLMMGARIQEIERCGDRIHFEKKEGQGPKTGWVSAAVNGRSLLERV